MKNFINLIDDIQTKLNESYALLNDDTDNVKQGFLLCMNVISSYLIMKATKGE